MLGSLLQLRDAHGFVPRTVIDVGAALGTFELYQAFPNARHILIEPIAENEPHLARLCAKLPSAEYLIAAAASQSGVLSLEVQPTLVHSSVAVGSAAPQANGEVRQGEVRQIATFTLDQLCEDKQLEPPYLLKLDVDGNEPDVLAGAGQMLAQTEYAIIEVSLFNQIHTVIDQMRSHGFVIYDIADLAWRPSDLALWQCDMAFVKENGRFRQQRDYTTSPAEQASLAQHLQVYRDHYIAQIEAFSLPGPGEPVEPPTLATSLAERLALRAVNAIAFPDWSQPEAELVRSLIDLLQTVLRQADPAQTTLLICLSDAEPEDANLALSSALLNLVSQQPDVDDQLAVSLVEPLTDAEWQALLPQLSYRVALPAEDQTAIQQSGAAVLKLH